MLTFDLVKNKGVAFGLWSDVSGVLTALSIVLTALVIFYVIANRKKLAPFEITAFSMIIAGSLGNLTDRFRHGYVVDFINLQVWPVFNIADAFITIGAIVYIIFHLKFKHEN